MATYIKTLKDDDGNIIVPRSKSKAITMEDGTNLEYAVKNRPATDIKLTGSLAESLGVPDGTSLATYLTTDTTKHVPVVTKEDTGKFLRVVDGRWSACTVPNADEMSF